jgi:hypothetical protein
MLNASKLKNMMKLEARVIVEKDGSVNNKKTDYKINGIEFCSCGSKSKAKSVDNPSTSLINNKKLKLPMTPHKDKSKTSKKSSKLIESNDTPALFLNSNEINDYISTKKISTSTKSKTRKTTTTTASKERETDEKNNKNIKIKDKNGNYDLRMIEKKLKSLETDKNNNRKSKSVDAKKNKLLTKSPSQIAERRNLLDEYYEKYCKQDQFNNDNHKKEDKYCNCKSSDLKVIRPNRSHSKNKSRNKSVIVHSDKNDEFNNIGKFLLLLLFKISNKLLTFFCC